MTPQEHYQQAEYLLKCAMQVPEGSTEEARLLKTAQIYATLATCRYDENIHPQAWQS